MKELFTDNWKFRKYPLDTSEEVYLNPDNILNPIDVPHDWLIYDTENLYEDSIGCYKKEFDLTGIDKKRYFVMFDGVYMDSFVYINGKLLGNWKYGYTAFEYEITDYILEGTNTIIVAVIYRSPNTRWYSGAGIFRNVWLRTTAADYLKNNGSYVVTSRVNGEWNVSVSSEIVMSNVPATDNCCYFLENVLFDKTGKECGYIGSYIKPESVKAQTEFTCSQKFTVENVAPWDLDNPYLYTLITRLLKNGICIDESSQRIGFRTIRFDADNGFFLNEKHVKIHGVCEHHDLGALGAAFNLAALRRKFEKLKAMGVNSIRTSHNPPATEFCDLADEMGFLIDSEILDMWESPKTKYDYGNYFNDCWKQDVDSWIRRDRNHPSIIMWSIGNEIYDAHHGRGQEITRNLRDRVRLNDPSCNAYITMGSNYLEWEGAQACMNDLDLAGYNYGERLYEDHHKRFPNWCIYGSETSSTVQSRGVYHFPADSFILTHRDEQCSSLGNGTTNWSAKSSQEVVIKDRDAKYCIGQYIWTGWDYIGEPTPYFNKNSYFGQIDTAGFEKDSYYLYCAEWTDYKTSPMVHILPYWNFNEGQLIDIRIYSNCPKVELFFNEVSKGTFYIDHANGKELAACYTLPYHEGTIRAVAYDESDNIVATDSRTSFEDVAKLILTPSKTMLKADGTDMIFLEISSVDNNNIPVANANNRCEVLVTGAARLVGLDNGDSTDYDSYKGTNKRMFNGKLLAMIAASNKAGAINITVKSAGLPDSNLTLNSIEAGKHIEKIEKNIETPCSQDIPIRQILLKRNGSSKLGPDNSTVSVTAEILPKNATLNAIEWFPMSPDGIESNIATVKDGVVTAKGDGSFRLCCSAYNGNNHPEVTSEYEFEINGMGETSFNPYKFVSAILRTSESQKNELSFQGGLFIKGGRNWIGFERVDFGDYGSDEITIPIFSFSDTLPLEIWEGTPEGSGKLLLECTYNSPSWYNHYQSNTFKLPCRLKGMKDISITTVSEGPVSVQGFFFKRYNKAYSRIDVTDYTKIVGDSFTIEHESITHIGNNVSIDYGTFDFTDGMNAVTVCGHSNIPINSIHIILKNAKESLRRIIDFSEAKPGTPSENGYIIQSFSLEPIFGTYSLSLIFLPGSNFDLKWFNFAKE